jgi:Bifunctional DNA primase/polymerase, N-terminal/Primase C terminal 1 (PriCT-1)
MHCLYRKPRRDVVRQWWESNPDFNIGIATGMVSGVFCVDIDSDDAEGALRALEKEHGEVPPTVEVITARGRHLYFTYRQDRPVNCSADDRIAPGIHVRGNGGYVLAPPSIHPSGCVDCARSVALAPGWLLDRITGNAPRQMKPTPPSVWRELVAIGVDEGERNNAATRLAGYFLRHRLDPLLVLELLQLWNASRCRPPLPADDIARIVNSICNAELRRRETNG